MYLLGYGLGRAWIEGLRTDQLLFFGTGIPVSQALSMIPRVASVPGYHLETIADKNRDKRRIEMANAKEELVEKIERVRKKMDLCIERREEYRKIYEYSVELDELLNQYIVAGY